MTQTIARLQLGRPSLKLRAQLNFPVRAVTKNFLTASSANGTFTFGVDYTLLLPGPVVDPTTAMIAVFDATAGVFKTVSISSLIASASQIEQHITAAGAVAVLPNAGIVRVDQAAGAPITLTLPLASSKTCPVLISDWKGDAGTNNITLALSGTDTFPGGLTSWKIAADAASIFLRPIAGAGYAI